jgi:uncharacterized protein YbbC (DUF1343 family)
MGDCKTIINEMKPMSRTIRNKIRCQSRITHNSKLIILCALFFAFCTPLSAQRVRIGAEILLEKYIDSLAGKRVGVICNHTSVLPNGVRFIDTLLSRGIKITVLFSPEHGIRGKIPAGVAVEELFDQKTGLSGYSLYGGARKPTNEMLQNVDVLIFDMQDVGARFYTYISTMGYCMIAAGENGKKFYVLDRPNPINGVDIEGPPLDLELRSFVGLYPIPVRHGMTVGEIAKMIIGEGYLNPSTVDLTVIPMEGWKRTMWYDETGLPWIAPSPNMKTLATATAYPGTCFFEATNFTEGRGTDKPFEYIGIPGLHSKLVSTKLNELKLPGVKFLPVDFTPIGNPSTAADPKFKNKKCGGVYVKVTDRRTFQPVLTGIMMLATMKQLYPKKFQVKNGLLNHLVGDDQISERLENGKVDKNIFSIYKSAMERFLQIRSKYLLY